jgi:formylglycine-generating enzyme required for sulfatase activity
VSFATQLLGFGLRQVIAESADSVVQAAEVVEQGIPVAAKVIKLVERYFRDHSRTLPIALAEAHDRAWQALAIALAGDGFLNRVKVFFSSGDNKGIREQVQFFLAENAFSFDGTRDDFRVSCLDELKRLRKSGLLSVQGVSAAEIARQSAGFRRQADPAGLVEEARRAVAGVADALTADYPNLSRLIRRPTPAGPPLLAAAFCYFFRRKVETDQALAHGLLYDGQRQIFSSQQEMLGGLERLAGAQAGAFDQVSLALATLGGRFDELFEQLGRIEVVAVQARDAAFHARAAATSAERAAGGAQGEAERARVAAEKNQATLERLREELRELKRDVNALGKEKGLKRTVRDGDSLSIRNDREKQKVKEFLRRFRALPEDMQRSDPFLLNQLGVLGLAVGENEAARQCFQQTAAASTDSRTRAEAHYNAYQALLQRGEQGRERALAELLKAAELDPQRFAPFPTDKFEPQRILGSGGFAIAFLCQHHLTKRPLVVKAIRTEGLDCDPADVIGEAQTLDDLAHPTIIRLRDCGFADAARTRPYLVTDFFDGPTLADYVRKNGPVPMAEFLPLARLLVQGLSAAHCKGVLHRDVTPRNILVRKSGSEWEARLIDFGLAIRNEAASDAASTPVQGRTPGSSGVAGTPEYAAPEQMGRLPGVKVGPYSDVYAFGKTCCYALFGTTEPKRRQWRAVPEELADVLEKCFEQELGHRHASFAKVLAVLEALDPARKAAEEDAARRQRERQERQEQDEARRQAEEQKRREQEKAARQQERARLRQDGEAKLARLVKDALERTRGKPTSEDTAAANELVREHHIKKDRAESIIREERERWQKAQPKEPQPGEVTTIDLGKGVEMKFAWCPPGTFLMGSPAGEPERSNDETQHRVTLTKGYWLGTHPVTQAQWQAVMGSNPSQFKGDTLPVETVCWDDCQAFVKKLSEKTGKRFRLPTEAEWEYACRAGTTTPFYFGETISTDQANYDGNYTYGKGKKGVYREKTTPVGSFPANAWGLFDIHGNVWEWCQDRYGPYASSDIIDPQSTDNGTARVLRGGSWYCNPGCCRSACRSSYEPGHRHGYFGCRVLLCLD